MAAKLSDVRLVVFDVDGVLTDGRLYYGPDGEMLKQFHVRDGVGIKLLQDFGIPVAVISAKSSPALDRRMKDLGVKYYCPGSADKWLRLSEIMDELGVQSQHIAYVGDDVIDLQVMTKVGLSIAPADAYKLVIERADIVLQSAGGQGVAREVADLVLAEKESLDNIYQLAVNPEFERKRGN